MGMVQNGCCTALRGRKMMIRRRVLAIVLALLTTIAFMPSCAWADGFNPEKTIKIVKVNPVYADVMTKSALLGAIEEGEGPVVEAEQVYSAVEDAGSYVRAQMKKKAASVTFKADIPGDEVDNIYAIIGEALKHTGVPDEGDYILWQYAGYEAYLEIGSKNYEITFEFGYYTDQQQEAQVTAAIDDVLDDMGECNTYEKIRYIYEYITDTVSYDHVHSARYELSHTAYAAAIEHTAVCQGYAALLYRMLLEEGIDSRIIAGLGNSENHGWNIVKIGPSYYNLDATWDAGKTSYSYFLKNNASFTNHQRMDFTQYGAYDYTSAEFNQQYPMAADNYSYCTGGHSWDKGTVTEDATCTESGIMTYTCTACHNQKTEVIEPKGHDIVTDEAVEPACEEAGRTEGSHCSVCNEVIKAQEEISALGHDWVESEVIEPTEFETGIRKYSCSRCKATKEEIISELGHIHKGEKVAGQEATCGDAGWKDYYHCEGCNGDFADKGCTEKIISMDSWKAGEGKIDPTGNHAGGIATCKERAVCEVCGKNFGEPNPANHMGETVIMNLVKPTCIAKGYTGDIYCCDCGKKISDGEAIEASGHKWDKGRVKKPATEEAEGIREYTCTSCGAAYEEAIPVLPHRHRIQRVPAVAATCTHGGSIEYWTCNKCGQCFSDADGKNVISDAGIYTPAKGHSYDDGTVVKRATLTMNGKIRYACTGVGCDESYDQLIYRPGTFKLSTSSYTYSGTVKKPTVTVKDTAGNTLKKDTDYTVSYQSGRKSVGKYGVTVTMKGKYSGRKTLYFKINPKSTSISFLSKGKKYFTVKWKKQSAKMAKYRITGYQVQYSTSSKMTSPKTVTIKGYSKTSKKISKLKAKKKYYVKVRTYRTVNGNTLYSSWSKVKTVTTR